MFLDFSWSQLQQLMRQDNEPCIFHLYTLLSTYWFLPALINHCENMQAFSLSLPWMQAHLLHPLRDGLAHGLAVHAWNHMWGTGQRNRAQERAPRPSCHQTCTSGAHLSPRDAEHSIMSPDTQTRQQSSAAVQSIDPAVLAKISGSIT